MFDSVLDEIGIVLAYLVAMSMNVRAWRLPVVGTDEICPIVSDDIWDPGSAFRSDMGW